jgi:hypothetical protein
VSFDSNEHEEHKTLQAGIDTTRKFITKELETTEKLNEFKDRLLREMTNIEKQGNYHRSPVARGCQSAVSPEI